MIRSSLSRRRLQRPSSVRVRHTRPHVVPAAVPPGEHRDGGGYLTPRLYPEALWDEPVPAPVRALFLTPRL